MMKATMAALGALALMAAAPAPNTASGVGYGGGVYYNPYVAAQQARQAATPAQGQQHSEIGVTSEGGGIYRMPAVGG